MKKILKTILTNVGGGLLFFLVVIFAFGYYCYSSFATKTDPSVYASIVTERLEWADKYKFLPRTIPKDAVKVAFRQKPGVLQDHDEIALRLTLPPERVQALLKELEDSGRTERMPAKDGGHWGLSCLYPLYDDEKQSSEGVRARGLYRLPHRFRVFWPKKVVSGYTAISIDTNEVFYFVTSR